MWHHLLLCPRFLLLLPSRPPLFPDLSPHCSSVFFPFAQCFSHSQASRHAVTSTWTRHPLLPGLLPPPCSPHQSLPSPHGTAAIRCLLQILLVAKTCPCSTFGAWLSDGFAAGSVLGGTGDLGAEQGLSPALASLLAGCHDSGGCDSQQSSLTQPMGFLLWTKQNLQSWVLLGPLSRGSGFCCHLLLQSDALPFWLELCASWSRHCIANKLRAQFCTPQR